MASAVESVNKALSNIGDTSFIEDFSDPQNERERLASLHYDSTLEEVLQDFPWTFARTFAILAVVSGEVPGWGYKYRYPTDCLMAKIVTDEGGYRLPAAIWFDSYIYNSQVFQPPRSAFEIQADPDDEGAKIILSDVEEAYLWYTKKIENLNQWTPLARQALEWALAMKFAIALKADDGQFARAEQMYQIALSKAQAHAFNEGRTDPQPESPAIQARA